MSQKVKKGTPQKKTAPGPSPVAADITDRRTVFGICFFLTAIVWVVFGQTLHHDFVNFDDNVYVYENAMVAAGLTWKGVAFVFTHFVCNFYHPLTMLSLMLNAQLNGIHPGGYHFGNVLLHNSSVVLLFLVLRRMTGALWRSAFVAALFAIHPLRVESVAWVAERKDVLSGLFFMLALGAYVRYVKKRSEAGAQRAALDYSLVLLFFAMSLLSKPSAVTLPFVLLLLDYWPLNRLEGQNCFSALTRLIVEKIPLFVLSVVASVVAVMAEGDAIRPATDLPLVARMGTPVVSYSIYIRQMFCPAGLVPYYPFLKSDFLVWKMILELVLLSGITAAALAQWRKRPYLLVGWFWYLGMLVPMIGIVQISAFARADRFTYLAQIGLYVLLTWTVAGLCAGWRYRRAVLGICAMSILAVLMFCACAQAAYWRNGETLWSHALAAAPDNCVARNNFGFALFQNGKVDEAIVQYRRALQFKPDYIEAMDNFGHALIQQDRLDEAVSIYNQVLRLKSDDAEAHVNLGNILLQRGKVDEAIGHFQQAAHSSPGYSGIHYDFANALFKNGNLDEAIAQYRQAVELNPDDAENHHSLGYALSQKGDLDEAMAQYQQALAINPNHAEAHYDFGNAWIQKGRLDLAIVQYQQALQIKPDYVETQANLAWVLATAPQASFRDGNQAVELAERASRAFNGTNPGMLRVLAAAYAEAGRFDDAVQTSQKAIQLARAAGRTDLVAGQSAELKYYQAGLPFHQGSPRN